MQSKRDLPGHRGAKWLLVLLLLVTACTPAGASTPQEPLTSTETPDPLVEPSAQDTATTVPTEQTETVSAIEPSPTPQPAALPTLAHKVCDPTTDTIDAAFIGDIGLADGTRLAPNTKFRKTWQVRNSGDCSWPDGTELVHITGYPLPGPQQVPVPRTGPARDITISVELMAPAGPGKYQSFWRLRTPDGRLFGAVLFVEIIVEEGAPALPPQLTVNPTTVPSTPTPQPTQTPSPTVVVPPTAVAATTTPTPAPTRTPVPTATPTATPVSDTSSTCGALDDRFHSVINQATALDIQVLCATGPIETVPGQVQLFRQNVDQDDPHLRFQSFMILRTDTDKIYVLDGKDANTYEATVTTHAGAEGVPPDEQPATCSGLSVPEGYIVPTGRIGATWCNYSLWISTAGWPWEPAADATLEIQEITNGLLIEATTDATATQAAQVYLIAIDFGARRATVD
jgi:hypothetical protein